MRCLIPSHIGMRVKCSGTAEKRAFDRTRSDAVGFGRTGRGRGDELADAVTELPTALPIEEGAGFPFGEILVGDAEAFELGFEKGPDVREGAEATDRNVGPATVLKPRSGLATELGCGSGDGSDALHKYNPCRRSYAVPRDFFGGERILTVERLPADSTKD